jgi:DNA-binding response OmpR family regulator
MALLFFQHPWAHRVLLHAARWGAQACHAAIIDLLGERARAGATWAATALLVRFDDGAASGAGCVTPEAALQDLRQGRASEAVLVPARDLRRVLDWLARLRTGAVCPSPAVVVLLPEPDAETRLAALRAGADAVLPPQASAALIDAQFDRLRQRAAPPMPARLEGPGGLRLEAATLRAWVGEQPLALKPGLFRLLWCLVAEPDRVFSLSALRVAIEVEATTQADSIHAYVSRLRKALRPHRIDACIQTVHRFGYRCVPALGSATTVSRAADAAPIDA